MRFMREKMRISQEELASKLGVTRGKIASYEDKTQGKHDFHAQLVESLDINLGKFLTETMDDANYSSFFLSYVRDVSDSGDQYGSGNLDILTVAAKLKNSNDQDERAELYDKFVKLIGRKIDENSFLKDEINRLQKDLIELVRK